MRISDWSSDVCSSDLKTRSLARQAIETGKVEVGGERAKPSRIVQVGNALRVVRGEEVFNVAVVLLSDQRGPAPVAQTLYAETEESRLAREERRAGLRAARAGYQADRKSTRLNSSH